MIFLVLLTAWECRGIQWSSTRASVQNKISSALCSNEGPVLTEHGDLIDRHPKLSKLVLPKTLETADNAQNERGYVGIRQNGLQSQSVRRIKEFLIN